MDTRRASQEGDRRRIDLRGGGRVRETPPMPVAPHPQVLVAAIAADLSDSAADRRIYLAAGGLVLLGLVMTIATAWWWHATRPDDPALGPLEVMSRKRWLAADDAERRRMLAAARPGDEAPRGTEPARAGVAVAAGATSAVVDLREAASAPLPAIDDLLVADEPEDQQADEPEDRRDQEDLAPEVDDEVEAEGASVVEHEKLAADEPMGAARSDAAAGPAESDDR